MRYARQLRIVISITVWVLLVSWISLVSHLSFGRFNMRTAYDWILPCNTAFRPTFNLLWWSVLWCYLRYDTIR